MDDENEKLIKKQKASLDNLVDYLGFGLYTLKLVVIIGVSYIIDGSQLTILSVMARQSVCQWNLSKHYSVTIQYCSVIGMALGGIYWGWLADKYGRKMIVIACSVMVFYFGILTVFSNNFVWFIVLRSILGFGVGGLIVGPCYIAEITSSKYRGKVFVGSHLFFALGSLYTAILAYLAVNSYGWRCFIVLAVIPIPLFVLFMLWLPETIPFLRNTGDYDTLIKTIYKQSTGNRKPLSTGDTVIKCQDSYKRGKFSLFLKRKYFLKLVIMCIMSFTGYFCYSGAIMQHAFFLELRDNRGYEIMAMDTPAKTKTCSNLSNTDYLQFIYASLGELIIVLLTVPIIDFLGRKRTVVTLLLVNIICYFSIMYIRAGIKTHSVPIMVMLLILRGSSVAIIVINHLFTAELFPTVVRASALGICAFFSRISIILASLMVHVLYPISIVAVLIIFAGLCVLCSLITTLLPDTTGEMLLNK